MKHRKTRDSQNCQKAIPLTSSPYKRSSKVITGHQSSSKAINMSHKNECHQNESHQNESHQNESHQNESHQKASHKNESHQNQSHQNES